jgi:DNA (cytosine-5)-methyltransferase 1|nr:MAG TPA: Cytosine specific methyltransferase [Caudoviricetes sp.]
MKFIDFFSGIGGFHSGLERAGMECVGWCEFDKFAQASYRAMYDTDNLWFGNDVTKVKGKDLPKADLWTFGFPCQDISIAGKQKGIKEGTRSGLFYEIMRLLDECKENKPQWIMCENVKNLLSIDGGGGFLTVVSEMAERGYCIEWKVYNSKDYGVPQNRERVYIVGYYGDRCPGKLLPIRRENTATLKQTIGGPQGERVYNPNGVSCTLSALGGGMGAKTGLYEIETECSFIDLCNNKVKVTENARCLTARYTAGVTNHDGVNSGVVSVQAILIPDRLEKRQNGRRLKEEGEPAFTLTSQDRHGILIKSANSRGYDVAQCGDGIYLGYPESETRRGRVQPQRSGTLTTGNNFGVLIDENPVRIRKLTPKECWRLQGFTDEQFEKAAVVNSNSQLYKQAGNAVTVNVVEEIGKHIMKVNAYGGDDEKRYIG